MNIQTPPTPKIADKTLIIQKLLTTTAIHKQPSSVTAGLAQPSLLAAEVYFHWFAAVISRNSFRYYHDSSGIGSVSY